MHKGPIDGESRAFVESTPTQRLETGLRAIVEIVSYPSGQLRLSLSRAEGPRNDRRIRQANTLMLNDSDEAKDHLDAIVDRLNDLIRQQAAEQPAIPHA